MCDRKFISTKYTRPRAKFETFLLRHPVFWWWSELESGSTLAGLGKLQPYIVLTPGKQNGKN